MQRVCRTCDTASTAAQNQEQGQVMGLGRAQEHAAEWVRCSTYGMPEIVPWGTGQREGLTQSQIGQQRETRSCRSSCLTTELCSDSQFKR